MARRHVILALAALLAACKEERKPAAIENHLATPGALLVVGTGASPVLLVSNANFQLEYASGSVLALDLAAIDESVRLHRVSDLVLSAVPLPSFVGPMALSPDRTRLLVTNRLSEGETRTSLDRVYFVDATDFSALAEADLRPDEEGIQSSLLVGADPFGVVTTALPPEGPGRPPRERAYVVNAGASGIDDGSISVVNLTEGTACANGEAAPCLDDALPPPRASQVDFLDVGEPSSVVFDGPGITPLETRTEDWVVTFVEGEGVCPDPSAGEPAGYWRVEGSISGVQRSHACTGFIYVTPDVGGVTFEIVRPTDDDGNPIGGPPNEGDQFSFRTYRGDFSETTRIFLSAALPGATVTGRGAGQIVLDPFRDRIYVTSRLTQFIYVLDANDFRFLGVFAVSTNVTGRDSRGLALSPDGSELYVVNRSPDALLIIDPDVLEVGADPQIVNDAVVASIPLGLTPSEIELSADGRFAYVTDFGEDALDVVDLQNRLVRKRTHVGDGPFALELSPDGRRAYVGAYFSSSIDVVDTDPTSAFFGEVITTIADEDFEVDRN